MADKKITDLTEMTAGQLHADDLVFVYDESLGTLKATKLSVLVEGLKARCGFKAYFDDGGGSQSVSSGVWTKVQLNTEAYDIAGDFDAVTNYRFTAPYDGYYLLCASTRIATLADQKSLVTGIRKNGLTTAILISSNYMSSATTGNPSAPISDIIYLNEDDYIELWIYHDHGSALNVDPGLSDTFMTIHSLER